MILSIGLITFLLTPTADAHCPEGGECFTEEKAAERLDEECGEARDKLRACNSELAECDNMEALKNKCKGNLEESRRDSRGQAKTIKVQDRKLAQKHDTGTVAKWTIGGFVVGVGVGGLLYGLTQ